jgi:hypothetical protein
MSSLIGAVFPTSAFVSCDRNSSVQLWIMHFADFGWCSCLSRLFHPRDGPAMDTDLIALCVAMWCGGDCHGLPRGRHHARETVQCLLVILNKTCEIVRVASTENPTREFVRQQVMLFDEAVAGNAYIIHENALMLNIDFLAYNLKSVKTSVEAPNMNIITERFFVSVRREALDNFLLIGRSQIERILAEYVAFYNSQRPHQGIQQQVPKPGEPETKDGAVCRSAVLGGLHHHYFRQAA